MTHTPAPRLLDGRRAAGVCCLRQPEDPPGISPGMCDPDSEWIMCAWTRGCSPLPPPMINLFEGSIFPDLAPRPPWEYWAIFPPITPRASMIHILTSAADRPAASPTATEAPAP